MKRGEMKVPAGAELGTRYGAFVVVGVLEYGRKARVNLKCDCGSDHVALLHVLKSSGGRSGCKKCQSVAKSERQIAAFDLSRYKGKRFGRLLVTGLDSDPDRPRPKTRLVCLCDCGGQAVVSTGDLTTGHTTSCGCFHAERLKEVGRETLLKHGNASDGELNGHTPLYRAWLKIRACCRAGKAKGFGLVCHDMDQRWDDFPAFYADFGPIGRYQTISRINSQLPWSKDNCYVNTGRRHLFEKRFGEVAA